MMSGDYTPSSMAGDYDPVGHIAPKKSGGGLPKPRKAIKGGMRKMGKASIKIGRRGGRGR